MGVLGEAIAAAAAIAAIFSAIFAWRQAAAAKEDRRSAEQAKVESRSARDEATALSKQANDQFVRLADAQETANRLTEDSLTRPQPRWELKHLSGSRWAVTNVGQAALYSASVGPASEDLQGFIRPEDSAPRTIEPQDSMVFLALQSDQSPTPRISILGTVDLGAGTASYRREITVVG